MYRLITEKLHDWKMRKGHKPLIIFGARQVGKTYIAMQFGKENYSNLVYFNFEGNRQLESIFEQDLNPNRIVIELEALTMKKIDSNTLIIFDEIQASERAITSLKYFNEEAPQYNIIAAGSLLGVAINRGASSYPVGKVEELTMYPMNFKEFLLALGEEKLIVIIENCFNNNVAMSKVLHDKAMSLYRLYLVVGGMPEAILEYIQRKDFDYIRALQNNIYSAYTADMTKYTTKTEAMKAIAVFNSIPYQLAKENTKFQYSIIKSGARASSYKDSITWLEKAGVVLMCYRAKEGKMPLEFYKDALSYKIYMLDVGLLSAKSNYVPSMVLSGGNIGGEAKGVLTENYLAMELVAIGKQIYYWTSSATAEVDFVIQDKEQIVPIECKAAENVKAKSFALFMKKYQIQYGIRVSGKNFGFENGIKSVPLYAVFCLR